MDQQKTDDQNIPKNTEKVPEFPFKSGELSSSDAPVPPEQPQTAKTTTTATAVAKTPEKPIVTAVVAKPGTVEFVKNLLSQRESALKNFLGAKEKALRFMSGVVLELQNNPALVACDPQSLIGACMKGASFGLYFGTGDCYLVPYAGMVQFQLGYKGVKTLAYRSGCLRMGTEIVYEKDEFSIKKGTDPKIIHNPCLTGDKGKAIAAYAWAETPQGGMVFKSMSKDAIMEIKKLSKASGSKHSPWNQNDPELWMWQKTAFKQMAKMIPTSDDLQRAIHLDDISERGGYIRSESEVVEVPFDNSDAKIEDGKGKKEALRKKKTE